MRNSIWEQLDLSDDDKKVLWNDGIFVFDTNVLLTLYRCTDETRQALINAFETLSDRIWIPHQVAYEFAKNRRDAIDAACSALEDGFEAKKRSFLNEIRRSLYLESNDKEMIHLDKCLSEWVDNYRKKRVIVEHHKKDFIFDKVLSLFDQKTGFRYDEAKRKELETEGNRRYAAKIPPGYKDSKKSANMFGDFCVWMQIIDHANEINKGIIFITSDQKEDWWLEIKGETQGPRTELRIEFSEKAPKLPFHMYSMPRFLEIFNEQSKLDNTSAVDELERIASAQFSNNTAAIDESEDIASAYSNAANHYIIETTCRRYLRESLPSHYELFSKFPLAGELYDIVAMSKDSTSLDIIYEIKYFPTDSGALNLIAVQLRTMREKYEDLTKRRCEAVLLIVTTKEYHANWTTRAKKATDRFHVEVKVLTEEELL